MGTASNTLRAALERLEAWLALQAEYPDRHISEHQNTYASLFDIRAVVTAARAALSAPQGQEPLPSGNYCSICNSHDQWCPHIPKIKEVVPTDQRRHPDVPPSESVTPPGVESGSGLPICPDCGDQMAEDASTHRCLRCGLTANLAGSISPAMREWIARYRFSRAMPAEGYECAARSVPMTDEQIKYMRDRFLSWTLPDNLNPDGGITFKRSESAIKYSHPMPVGTNFLDAEQAEIMVRHMVEGMPCPAPMTREKAEEMARGLYKKTREIYSRKRDEHFANEDPNRDDMGLMERLEAAQIEAIADALQSVAGSDDTALLAIDKVQHEIPEEFMGDTNARMLARAVWMRACDAIRAAIAGEKTR